MQQFSSSFKILHFLQKFCGIQIIGFALF